MQKVQAVPVAALGATVALCAAVAVSVGLGPLGWTTGVACGAALAATVGRRPPPTFGPADAVTTVRAVLACGVAALAADALVAEASTATLLALAATALVLDAVDGAVARRTGTASARGARYDMEVDAFLIAVLSVHVASLTHWWVLAIGAMRYAFVAAGWLLPWLQRPSPPRYLAKVVAAAQGVVLLLAASQLPPDAWVTGALATALVLLVASFGRQSWWLWRHRDDPAAAASLPEQAGHRPAWVATAAAVLLLWLALAPPRLTDGFAAADLLRIPVEGLVLVAVALVLPRRPRQVLAVVAGLLAAVLVVLRVLGLGFHVVLDRPFHVLGDWSYLPKGVDVVRATDGDARATALVLGAAAGAVALAVVLPWAARRAVGAAADRPRRSWQVLAALTATWLLCATVGGPAGQVAATRSAGLAVDSVQQVRSDFRDHAAFGDRIEADRHASTPADELLAGLRGRDVLLVWVESYGRVALEDPAYAPGILEVLEDGDRRLDAAGYHARSAYLASPTFGAASWLAHATLQSGLWVDSERRYRQLLGSDRLSLTRAFDEAGWRTAFTVPANTRDWPEGAAYYGFDQLYDSRNVGYAGPEFGYASMPDQYTLEHFRRTELAPADRPPVFAEIDLVSSHHPWAPLPELVPWERVDDGSVFRGMPDDGEEAVDGSTDPATAQRLYGASIEYTWRTLVSFLETHPDPDRVVIIAGDHQPHSFVSGDDPGRDVPVTVLSRDRTVVDRISDWGWQPRLHPGPDAPVWRMDAFRDRLFRAYDARR